MSRLGNFARDLKGRLFAPPVEREVDEEVAFHLEMRVRELMAAGMDEATARREAETRFGDVPAISVRMRDLARSRDAASAREQWTFELVHDVRYALRQLRSNPGFAAAAIVTLALGIGASTSIFSIANAVLVRPYPFTAPEQIVRIYETNPTTEFFSASEPNYIDFRDQNRTFTGIAAYQRIAASVVGDGEPERLGGMRATENFFRVMGIEPLRGAGFTAEHGREGGERVALISRGLWQRRFGDDPDIVGRSLDLDGTSYRVLGVTPGGLDFLSDVDLWLPWLPSATGSRGDHRVNVVGRLKGGVTLAQGLGDLRGISRRLAEQYPASNKDWGVNAVSLRDWIVGPELERRVLVLVAAVGVLLLMACVNVANLLLARAGARQREMSVRAALGAGRWRIARQLVVESLVLALIGAGLGVALTFAVVPVLRDVAGTTVSRLETLSVDWRVLGFAGLASVVTGLLFGAVPALQLSRLELGGVLRAGARIVGGGRLRGGLIVVSVGLALVLLAGAGLVGGSFARLMRVDPGFETDGVLVASLAFPRERYADADRMTQFVEELMPRLHAVPGIQSAGVTNIAPFSGGSTVIPFAPADRPAAARTEYLQAAWRTVTPGYFDAMGITLTRGRMFDATDRRGAPPSILISETMARRAWPGQDPVGRFVEVEGSDAQWAVAGVVSDTRAISLAEEPDPQLYLAYAQESQRSVWLIVRTSGDPKALLGAVQREVWALDPRLPLARAQPLSRLVADVAAEPRLTVMIFAMFAAAALALAVVGVYGLVAYGVTQRTREIGVRLALGARPGQIVRGVVGRGFVLAAAGVGLGLVVARWLAGYARTILYGVEPTDPATYAAVAGVLLTAASLASLVPARRAARLHPTVALRSE